MCVCVCVSPSAPVAVDAPTDTPILAACEWRRRPAHAEACREVQPRRPKGCVSTLALACLCPCHSKRSRPSTPRGLGLGETPLERWTGLTVCRKRARGRIPNTVAVATPNSRSPVKRLVLRWGANAPQRREVPPPGYPHARRRKKSETLSGSSEAPDRALARDFEGSELYLRSSRLRVVRENFCRGWFPRRFPDQTPELTIRNGPKSAPTGLTSRGDLLLKRLIGV